MSRAKGKIGEDIAEHYLKDNGWAIKQRNYTTRYGEIDIVAVKDDRYHFVEVKCYRANSMVDPLLSITPRKLSRIRKSISFYCIAFGVDGVKVDMQIDVVVVEGGGVRCHLEGV